MHPERVLFEALLQVVNLLSLRLRSVMEATHGVVVSLVREAVEVVEHRADRFRCFAGAPDPIGAAE